jgi:uncharacterized membrane protein YgcG
MPRTSLLPRLLLLLAFLGGGAPLAAQERQLTIQDFDAQIRVEDDGTLQVEERLTLRFEGSWQGVDREYSLEHRTAQGRRARLSMEVGTVTDGEGRALTVERSEGQNRLDLRIWVPDAQDAVRTVVIPYRVRGGLRYFDAEGEISAQDELYWNVTGTDWRIPIERVTTQVELPRGLPALEAWGYTGPAGSTERAVSLSGVGGEEVRVETQRYLGPGEGLTVSVRWAGGVLPRPTARDRNRQFLQDHWPAGLPFLTLLLMTRIWWTRGRDPRGRSSLVVEFEPPPGMTPSEGGTLLDHKAEIHDITSILVDLAVRGYLRIEEIPGNRIPAFLGGKSADWAFHATQPQEAWGALLPYERRFLEGLFHRSKRGGATTAQLSELRNRFYQSLGEIRTGIYDRLKAKGLYRSRPDRVTQRWSIFGFVLMFASVFLFSVVADIEALFGVLPHSVTTVAGLIASSLVVMGFSSRMGARTVEGVRAREHIRGFQEFLSRVEADYYDRIVMHPELFERYLPWAMALRVDQRWAKAFEGIVQAPPNWYQSRTSTVGAFQASAFASQVGALATQANQSFSSTPSGSGSGGGGSSGGGSGGGGGGGF